MTYDHDAADRRFAAKFAGCAAAAATIAAALLLLATPAPAAEAPVKQDSPIETGLSIKDCLMVLQGLTEMDQIERRTKPFEFARGGMRLDISHDIAVLTAVQAEAQPAQQKIFFQVVRTLPDEVVPAAGDKPATTKPATSIPNGTPEAAEYDRLLTELTARPCHANLARINASDLNLDKNPIPVGILAAIDKILDRGK
jgi:hypothetical protein